MNQKFCIGELAEILQWLKMSSGTSEMETQLGDLLWSRKNETGYVK